MSDQASPKSARIDGLTSGQKAEIQLSGRLAEFREALRLEIDAAEQQAAESAVSLIDGRFTARIGPFFQYAFTVENILNVPSDTPGTLQVRELGSFDATINSIEGLKVTIAVQVDLGRTVPQASLKSSVTHLMKRLIGRIEALADKVNVVGDRIMSPASATGEIVHLAMNDGDTENELNEEQLKAVGSAIGRDTTFIWGPPGTGKTKTIGAIGGELFRRERSVLLVSHTNSAVDQALIEISRTVHKDDLRRGLVLRIGEPRDARILESPELLVQTHVARRCEELESRRKQIETEREDLIQEVVKASQAVALAEWVLEAEGDIATMRSERDAIEALRRQLTLAVTDWEVMAAETQFWIESAAKAKEIATLQIDADSLSSEIAKLQTGYRISGEHVSKARSVLVNAETLLNETTRANVVSRLWRGLPTPQSQEALVIRKRAELETLVPVHKKIGIQLGELLAACHEKKLQIEEFSRLNNQATPKDVLVQVDRFNHELKQARSRLEQTSNDVQNRTASLTSKLSNGIAAVRHLGFVEDLDELSINSMLDAIVTGHGTAKTSLSGLDLDGLKSSLAMTETRLASIADELASIEAEFKVVETKLIAGAVVVATTLTSSYLRDSIQNRRFDTVILDEASMAPIPALWIAASLADRNGIVVGDFKQLPPIVISDAAIAKKWLGRDVFEVAEAIDETRCPCLVQLKKQFRMHREISGIANELFYGTLENASTNTEQEDDSCLDGWYRRNWEYDSPVLLVDTGPLNAWVTSVSRGRSTSRLNFLSATACVDLAERLLADGRPQLSTGSRPRILVISPYRPHARLLELLIREHGLEAEIVAGTVHTFQGSEADVVILDLVNDEPHFRVNMFIPDCDGDMERLFNVAITRARRRLIVVGDFDYISIKGKAAFAGRRLIPELSKNGKRVSALDVIPTGLFGRSAAAHSTVHGGSVDAPHERTVVTQSDFYSMLMADLNAAQRRVVIYSAFLTEHRQDYLAASLRAAVERGVGVFVVTKHYRERKKPERSGYLQLERRLASWGVRVIHKRGMHEKLVFVDEEILWSGSLNPLSFSNTQEIMERRCSAMVVKDYAATLRLNELVAEFDNAMPSCPCCENELIAAEGRDEPFYWRCVNDKCYSRRIKDARPENGVIPCRKCGSPVEFFVGRAGKALWRCNKNARHQRYLNRGDLLLPKMRALISQLELAILDERFKTTARSTRGDGRQQSLF